MKRQKHPKDAKRKRHIKHWQGYVHPTNKTLRKMLKLLDLACGSAYRKVGGWFEYN